MPMLDVECLIRNMAKTPAPKRPQYAICIDPGLKRRMDNLTASNHRKLAEPMRKTLVRLVDAAERRG